MYYYLLIAHSIFRWLAFFGLVVSLILFGVKFIQRKSFSPTDDLLRHSTATLFHIQLIIGMLLLAKSTLVLQFWQDTQVGFANVQLTFFGLLHPLLMFVAIIIITIGSAKAKRMKEDVAKFRTVLLWFGIGFLLLMVAIPWSFSPWVSRPNFRPF
ncbi:MAG: hypothetical protein AAF960_26770 [Bacteroidota bacterium]